MSNYIDLADPVELSAAERLQRIAAIFARGVIRWRELARSGDFIDAPESTGIRP